MDGLVNLQYLKEPCENYVLATIDTINKIHQYVPFGPELIWIGRAW
jgi:hypothetical protein